MLRWIEAPGPHESSINQYGVGHPRTLGIPLIDLVVDYRDFMLQSLCCGVMPRWVSDTILDNASAIDRHVNLPVIEARQCPVPACGPQGLRALDGY